MRKCGCADLDQERLANARARGVAVEHLGDVLYVVASTSKLHTTYDVEAIGDDWRDWTCDCLAPDSSACIHKRAAWLYAKYKAREASRKPKAHVTLTVGGRAVE